MCNFSFVRNKRRKKQKQITQKQLIDAQCVLYTPFGVLFLHANMRTTVILLRCSWQCCYYKSCRTVIFSCKWIYQDRPNELCKIESIIRLFGGAAQKSIVFLGGKQTVKKAADRCGNLFFSISVLKLLT